jgi:hypothetical protein
MPPQSNPQMQPTGRGGRTHGELELGFSDIDPDERHTDLLDQTARVGPTASAPPCRMRAQGPRNCPGSQRRSGATPRLTNGLNGP